MKQTFKFFAFLLAVTLLAGCKDEPDLTENVTKHFDKEFALLLEERGYIPNAEKITPADVKDITYLDVSGSYEQRGNLTSLAGIEYFSALDTLNCYFNQLTTLDVSNNTALTNLDCSGNQLTTLDVSNNTALTYLACISNQLTALDVSKNTMLDYLRCGINQLTTLDVSKNTKLTILDCYFNQLTALDISGCTALDHLECRGNQLTALDVSKNKALIGLNCYDNPGNGTIFPITAWFDNNSIPSGFTTGGWDFNGNQIKIEYIKK